ncbi:MAG: GTP-binding protein [Lachnospiraceae bacterium]|nr:GTP-binding protein [Lachnospiraceae bacterium]
MIKIDLITGFLGAGKTTFIRNYAKYLINQGMNIGILENDFGAVNVDAMLLQDILGDNCTLEMVAGGCDADCHSRRFKTKLIAMGMCGYDRILVEPSGIFDMDEFFDVLHEEPLERWYEIGSVITIIDAGLTQDLSDASHYLLASEAAHAGTILYSHTTDVTKEQIAATEAYVKQSLELLHCKKLKEPLTIKKDFDALKESDYNAILSSGYHAADYAKFRFNDKTYDSLYFMNMDFSEEFLRQSCEKILQDPSCGKVFRIKGFQKLPDSHWISVNATHEKIEIQPVLDGQAILIVIGEKLNKETLEQYWGKSKA